MSRSLPTGRTGRLLALGLTSLLLAAFALGIVVPVIGWHGDRAETLARRGALARRMEALVAALPGLQQQAAAVSTHGTEELALLEGDSDSVAGAALQERLQTMFVQAGAQLNSVETLPGEEAGAYRRIRLRISFTASWPVLLAVLRDIHVATPVLLVNELQVQPALHRIGTVPGTFDVACAIFAFRSGSSSMVAR